MVSSQSNPAAQRKTKVPPEGGTPNKKTISVLPGDGIGPEITTAALVVLWQVAELFDHDFDIQELPIGGAAIREYDSPLPPSTMEKILASDAVLLGAVGSPEFDHLPPAERPEAGLLQLRQALQVYANIRPVQTFPALMGRSPVRLKAPIDLVVVRELTGGIYFGEPRYRKTSAIGERYGVNTLMYSEHEIARIAQVAFQMAHHRRGKVTSVDKANVLETSQVWREIVTEIGRTHYPEIQLEHQYVDNCAMQLVLRPEQFDVILTDNMFGDILSDEAAVLAGSLGLLPSASLGDGLGLYEPIHGSAPDLAGKNQANPVGTMLSLALCLRHSFGLNTEALSVEQAVAETLAQGFRTRDIAGFRQPVGLDEFTEQVCQSLKQQAAKHILFV
ncbi:MAG: 3-isopropylmalate dehydrogenase [Blastocatellia bacterium]|nr:3-isopropylmalate dehydrogenase [Blastocatellia bacterium]